MSIPTEAVEAAWRAALANDSLRSLWRNADAEWRDAYKSTLRNSLEAARPFIAAQAWDAAVASLEYPDGSKVEVAANHNPYRSEA